MTRLLAAIILLVMILIVPVQAQSNHNGIQILETGVEPDNYVNIRARVFQNRQPVPGLTSSAFSVSEPATPLNVTIQHDQNVILVVMVNNFRMNSNRAGQVHAFLDYYADQVAITGDKFILADGNRVFSSTRVSDLTSVLDQVVQSNSDDSFNLSMINSVIAEINAARIEMPNAAVRAILIGNDVYYSATMDSLADRLSGENLPLYVIGTRLQDDNPTRINELTRGGGTYFEIRNGVLRSAEGSTISLGMLPLFTDILKSRTTYTITYQALSTTPGMRSITLNAQSAGATFSYNAAFTPLAVTIEQSTASISRSFIEAGSNALTNLSTEIKARVDFKSGAIQRQIETLNLLVYPQGGTTPSIYPASSLVSGDGTYSFVWDLTNFTTPNSSSQLEFEVHVRDTSGIEARTARYPVTVSVGEIIELVEPELRFVSPTNFAPKRSFLEEGGLDDANQTLTLELKTPETFKAQPQTVSLIQLVNGLETVLIDSEPIELNDQQQFTLPWDISNYQAPNTSTPINLTVEIKFDAASPLTASSEFTVTVGAPLPVAQWMICRAFPSISECPFTAEADMPTMVGAVSIVILLSAFYLRFTTRGRQLSESISQKTQNVVRAMTQVLDFGGSEATSLREPIAQLEWSDPTSGNSGTIGINSNTFVLGREISAGCDSVISSSSVSGQHLKITYDNAVFRITDMYSSNGTYVNNRKLEPSISRELKDADQLKIGAVNAKFISLIGSGIRAETIDVFSDYPHTPNTVASYKTPYDDIEQPSITSTEVMPVVHLTDDFLENEPALAGHHHSQNDKIPVMGETRPALEKKRPNLLDDDDQPF